MVDPISVTAGGLSPGVSNLITGGIGAIAGLFGGSQANQTNIKLAREQMKFQERMSSTAWQRAVADMKLAGINPMLSFMQGGASSPSGSQGRVEDIVSPAVSTALQAARMSEELKLLRQQTANVFTNTLKQGFEGADAEQQVEISKLQLQNIKQQMRLRELDIRGAELDLPRRGVQSQAWRFGGEQIDKLRESLYGRGGVNDWLQNNPMSRFGRWNLNMLTRPFHYFSQPRQ